MTTRKLNRSLLILAAMLLLAPAGLAQSCFNGDDGFDAGCCNIPTPTLPTFNAVTIQAEYGALLGCHPTFVVPPFPVTFSQPNFVLCDYAIINVNAPIMPGLTISGMLAAKYSRTWTDFNSPVLGQVYRFLVNGDLTCSSSNSMTPCTTILPRCAALNIPVHFDGHIDYSCDLFNPGQLTVSFSLNHMQGCITHAPWSAVPLGGAANHDEVSYHLVGPAPFTFGTGVPAPQGAIMGEAIRTSYLRMANGFVYQCNAETKIANLSGSGFIITAQNPHCNCGTLDQCTNSPIVCGSTPGGGCFAQQTIQGLTCCPIPNVPFQGFPIGGTPISQTGFLSQTVGSWGPGPGYPYNGNLTIYFGVLTYADPCNKANWNIHAVVGACTSNVYGQGFNTTTCGNQVGFSQGFLDLQNVLPLSNPNLPPGYGSLAAADVIWNIDF
jgi:hypothetical protein